MLQVLNGSRSGGGNPALAAPTFASAAYCDIIADEEKSCGTEIADRLSIALNGVPTNND